MKLKNFRIKNFKCFDDTGLILLSDGMNIVAGQNNAGKTALLQALELRAQSAPHRSIGSIPEKGDSAAGYSEIDFSMLLTQREFRTIIGNRNLTIPFPDPRHCPPELKEAINWQSPTMESMMAIWNWYWNLDHIEFKLTRAFGGNFSGSAGQSHGLYSPWQKAGGNFMHVVRQVQSNGSFAYIQSNMTSAEDVGSQISQELVSRIFRFSAERFTRGSSGFGTSNVLLPDATNLAEVLHVLQSYNPESYGEFIRLVREVLPQVQWISVVPIDKGELRIDVWSIDKKRKRDDLTVPLDASGTGIGQVLAILFVVYTNEDSRVILIDEPQSFLHPAAARKLMEVLRAFPQHQLVVSTHSAGVISAAHAQEILVLQNIDSASRISVASTSDNRAMQSFLEMLGTRLSDVFGMDRIIWVEGPTEEIAFPRLLEKMGEAHAGTSIISIRNTGDLIGKDKEKFFEIYKNVTDKASILPSEIAFILDSEDREETSKAEIVKRSKNRAFFLPRRMFENYLLHPRAIATIANTIPGFSSQMITQEAVLEFLTEAMRQKDYWKPLEIPGNSDLNSPRINGARVLEKLFRSFSDHRVEYDKTKHSPAIFEWMLNNDLDALSELVEFMRSVLADIRANSK